MVELYVDNKKVDLNDEIDINITYTSLDVSSPTAIKNNFSKTIKIPGTPDNNMLFGNIWRIERQLIEDPIKLTGVNFDTRKRVPFNILNSGAVVESGYLQLNNIIVNNNIVSYEITLFGGLGDFFYNLMYNEDGTEKTLYDLYWCWKTMKDGAAGDSMLTHQAEDYDMIYTWNAKSIAESWASIRPFLEAGEEETYYVTKYKCTNCETINETDEEPCTNCGHDEFIPVPVAATRFNPLLTRISNDITAIPTYNGLSENFASDKMLVAKKSIVGANMTTNIKNYLAAKLPRSRNVTLLRDALPFGSNYTLDADDSYGLLTAAREMDKYEAKDMRCKHMNIGLRLQKLLERISDPENNGGYTVEWHHKVLDSPYYGYSWIILGRPDFAEEETTQYSVVNNNILTVNPNGTYNTSVRNLILKDGSVQVDSIDCSGIDSPQLTIKYRPVITTNGNIPSLLYNHYGTYEEMGSRDVVVWTGAYWPLLCVTTYVKDNDTYIYSKTIAYSLYQNDDTMSPIGTFGTNQLIEPSAATEVIKNYVQQNFKRGNNTDFYSEYLDKFAIDQNNIVAPEVTVSTPLSQSNHNITVENVVNIVTFNMTSGPGTAQLNVTGITEPTTFEMFGISGRLKPKWAASNYVSITPLITTSSIGNIGGTNNINVLADKRTLLGNTKSPFKYLTDFTKLLNLKYIYDKVNKKISIVPLDYYYKTDANDWVDAVIDYGKEVKINAQAIEYKTLTIDLDSDKDCYPVYLYNKSYHKPFASKTIDTGNEFTDKNLDLLDGSTYKEGSPYRQSSIYYDRSFAWLPSPARQNNYTWSLYCVSGDTYVCDDNSGTAIYQHDYPINSPGTYGNLVVGAQFNPIEDLFPKIAQFDKDNKYVENTETTFVFLNGFVRNWRNYQNANGTYDTVAYYGLTDYIRIMTTLAEDECYLYEYTNNFTTAIPGAQFANSVYPWNIPNFSKNLTSRFVGNTSLHTHFSNYWWPHLDVPTDLTSASFWASWYINKPVVESWPEANVEFMTNCSAFISPNYSTNYTPTHTHDGITLGGWSSSTGLYNKTDDSIYTRFWKNYLSDLYDKNTKEITVYMNLKNMQPEEAMRRLWIVNGTSFIITKIHDYSPFNKQMFNKTTLRKVTDIHNYMNIDYGGEGRTMYFNFFNYTDTQNSYVSSSATTLQISFMTNYPSLSLATTGVTSSSIDMVNNVITVEFPANTGDTTVTMKAYILDPANHIVGTWNIEQEEAPAPPAPVTWWLTNTTNAELDVTLHTREKSIMAHMTSGSTWLFTDQLPFDIVQATVMSPELNPNLAVEVENGASGHIIMRNTQGLWRGTGTIHVTDERHDIRIRAY